MFEADDIRDWQGEDVVDVNGSKIGPFEQTYFDNTTEQPVFATVRIGLPGKRKLVFVPLDGARVSPKHLRVQWEKDVVKEAPFLEIDGELTGDQEPEIFEHYKYEYHRGATGERRLGRR